MRPSRGTTPSGPVVPQYTSPLMVIKSKLQPYSSTSKATTWSGTAGSWVTVHDSLVP
jgi:hypothetical protein